MLTNQQITRLLDIGYAACHTGNVAQARTIMEGVLADRPGHVAAKIGLAYSHLTINEFDEAEAILKEVLEDHPGDPDALAYLGLNCMLAGQKDKAREVLGQIPEDAAAARPLVGQLLDQLNG
jgi:thioredoxin-like negative regulator of GroEL